MALKELNDIQKRMHNLKILHKIGMHLTNRVKLEIIRQKAVDHGRLLNGVSYFVGKDQLTVTAMGTHYAKYVEYGTKPSEKMAQFLMWRASQREAAGRKEKKNKGVVVFETKNGVTKAHIRARPFFFNSIQKEKKHVARMLGRYIRHGDT